MWPADVVAVDGSDRPSFVGRVVPVLTGYVLNGRDWADHVMLTIATTANLDLMGLCVDAMMVSFQRVVRESQTMGDYSAKLIRLMRYVA